MVVFFISFLLIGMFAEQSRTPQICLLLVDPSVCDLAKRKADATNILFSLTLISVRLRLTLISCTTSNLPAVNFHSWSQFAGEVVKIDSQLFNV